jgi:hypothetical protein
MTSYALHIDHRREGTWLDHLRVRWASTELDHRLAEGARRDSDRLLMLRAARLVTPASRARVATGLEGVVAAVNQPYNPLSAAVPVRRRPVRGARHELMALAGDLRHMPAVHPRGVAMAERLITDPCSPLYTATSSDEVVRAVHAVTHWLSADPARP